jgi:hypothetical protein
MKEKGNPSTFYGAFSPPSARTWHKAELDKNCLFSKAERRIKNWEREKRKRERKRTQCSTSGK